MAATQSSRTSLFLPLMATTTTTASLPQKGSIEMSFLLDALAMDIEHPDTHAIYAKSLSGLAVFMSRFPDFRVLLSSAWEITGRLVKSMYNDETTTAEVADACNVLKALLTGPHFRDYTTYMAIAKLAVRVGCDQLQTFIAKSDADTDTDTDSDGMKYIFDLFTSDEIDKLWSVNKGTGVKSVAHN